MHIELLSKFIDFLKQNKDKILKVFLPTRKERKKYFDTYGTLCPLCFPPIGMLILCLLQIAMFIFYTVRENHPESRESIFVDTFDSMWIYDPKKVRDNIPSCWDLDEVRIKIYAHQCVFFRREFF